MDLKGPEVSVGDWIVPLKWYNSDFSNDKKDWGGLDNRSLEVKQLDRSDGTILCRSPNDYDWWVSDWRLDGSTKSRISKPLPRISRLPDIDDRFTGINIHGISVRIAVYQVANMGFGVIQVVGESDDGQRHVIEVELAEG